MGILSRRAEVDEEKIKKDVLEKTKNTTDLLQGLFNAIKVEIEAIHKDLATISQNQKELCDLVNTMQNGNKDNRTQTNGSTDTDTTPQTGNDKV